MKILSKIRIVTILFVLSYVAFVNSVAYAANLVAHRAVYSIKLGDIRSGANLEAAHGLMTISLEKSCVGWVVSQHMNMKLHTAEGKEINQDYQFSGWESLDLKNYRFVVRSRMAGNDESFTGKAALLDNIDGGTASYTVPEKKNLKLPTKSLFPIGHMALLIDSALAGEKQVSRPVFEGTEGGGAQTVSAFIGATIGPEKHGWNSKGPLMDRRGWKMRLGYYKAEGQSSTPQFEIELLQLDNGVVPYLVQVFPTFALVVNLKKIEKISMPIC